METYVVHVTKECNCKCVYCYEQDKTSTYTYDEIYHFISNLVKHRTSDIFNIEFLGGEPLLAFNHVKSVVDAFKYDFPEVTINNFIITTNGTILTYEIIEFLQENPNVSFCASLDGNKYMNMLRVTKDNINTYDRVIDNLKTLISHSITPAVHMVTHPYNIAYLSEGIVHLYNLGIRNIGIGTVESTITIGKEYCDKFISELGIISRRIKSGQLSGLYVNELNSLKPRTDNRYYIRDSSGKLIGESYGRSGNDITSHSDVIGYNAQSSESSIGTLIEDIREIVYTNHQIIMGE